VKNPLGVIALITQILFVYSPSSSLAGPFQNESTTFNQIQHRPTSQPSMGSQLEPNTIKKAPECSTTQLSQPANALNFDTEKEAFFSIPTNDYLNFIQTTKLNQNKFTHEAQIRVQDALRLYNDLSNFFKRAGVGLKASLDKERTKNKFIDELGRILEASEFSSIKELTSYLHNFAFSMTIDNMLYAFPISEKTQIDHYPINLSQVEALSSFNKNENSETQINISSTDYIQQFAVYNADSEPMFEAFIIISKDDLDANMYEQWNVKELLTTRFNSARPFVNAFWVFEPFGFDKLLATPLKHHKTLKEKLLGKNIFQPNPSITGVFYAGNPEDAIIQVFHSTFEFNDKLNVFKKAKVEKQFTYENGVNRQSLLINLRTKNQSKARKGALNSIPARPGDIIEVYQYWLFKPSEPTETFLMFDSSNRFNTTDRSAEIQIFNLK
jgi:hypothetical protein